VVESGGLTVDKRQGGRRLKTEDEDVRGQLLEASREDNFSKGTFG